MSRVTQLFFSVGLSLGVILTLFYHHYLSPASLGANSEEATPKVFATVPVSNTVDLNEELIRLRSRVSDLEQQLVTCNASEAPDLEPEAESSHSSDSSQEPQSSGSSWKVSAIEKFVPLSEDQRTRLLKSYSLPTNDTNREPLENIIGGENAKYYREQVQAAFSRMEQREFERELVWLSRQLHLDSNQEMKLIAAFSQIDQQLKSDALAQLNQGKSSAAERAMQLARESKEREKLRSEKAKEILSPDQYEGYIREQSDSPEADMAVFHGE